MDPSELREQSVSAFAKGRFAKAAELYEAYCAQVPTDSQAWLRLGDAWSRLRKKDKAVAAYYQAAKLYADSGFFPRAIAACKLVLEIEPEHLGVKSMLEELYMHKAAPRAPKHAFLSPKAEPVLVVAEVEEAEPVLVVAEVAEAEPVLVVAEAEPLVSEESSGLLGSVPHPIPLPGKTLDVTPLADEIPIVLGQEELSQEHEEEDSEKKALPIPTPPVTEKHASLPWAEAMKPPSIRPTVLPASLGMAPAASTALPQTQAGTGRFRVSSSGTFYAIEDAAKASLEAQGENPNDWLSVEKHAMPPAGFPVDIPLFSDLPQAALMALFNYCPLRRFAPGTVVISQGELGNSFFVICSGEVRVFRVQEGEQVELAILKEGEFFGEMALLSGEPRSAFVEAVEPDTQVLEIPADALVGLSRKFPQISTALWRFYRQRLLSNVMASSLLFRPFALEDRQQLIRCFQAVDVGPSEVVVAQHQKSEGLFVVLVGHLEVIKNGKKVAVLREGECFGEISLLTRAPATASVVAVERSSLLKLPANEFNTLISTHPQVLELLSQLMEERMKAEGEFPLDALSWETGDFGALI